MRCQQRFGWKARFSAGRGAVHPLFSCKGGAGKRLLSFEGCGPGGQARVASARSACMSSVNAVW